MKQFIYPSFVAALAFSTLVSCKPKIDEPAVDKGDLNVSKYVAVGNSITSGFADAALYYDGQMVSYPNLLAEQFKLIGGGEFKQPLVPMSSVGVGSTGNARMVLGYKQDCKGVAGLSPVPLASSGDLGIFLTSVSAQRPFNNVGVPGAKSFHVPLAGYGNPANGFGNYNPFFARMIADYAGASMLSEAASQNPSFFSLFIGNNDVLSYALAGGAADSVTPSYIFNASIDGIVNTMMAGGAKGVIGNIPDVTSLPYFTTIPYNGLVLTRQGQVDSLNFAYALAGVSFSLGANAFVMALPAPPFARKMKANEMVLLSTPQDSIKCKGWGSRKPLPNQFVLNETEVQTIQAGVNAFNAKLSAVASAKGLAYVDVNAFMAKVKTGIIYNGNKITTTFVSGGAFSLDGVHLTPLGNAMLANEFIRSINSTYKSTLPLLDATKYHGVVFP